MKIRNTDVNATKPWPAGMLLQGGSTGIVIRPSDRGGDYRTAFVEAFPEGTFIRGEGRTITEAEEACWTKYQRHTDCDGTGQPHGPFEPRQYENGCGFCVRCGAWFTGVCEPSINHQINSLACRRVEATWGSEVVGVFHKWRGLVRDEEARIRAFLASEVDPPAATEDPTPEELATSRAWTNEAPLTEDEQRRLRVVADVLLGQMAQNLPAGP
jgi:hypothetical protein